MRLNSKLFQQFPNNTSACKSKTNTSANLQKKNRQIIQKLSDRVIQIPPKILFSGIYKLLGQCKYKKNVCQNCAGICQKFCLQRTAYFNEIIEGQLQQYQSKAFAGFFLTLVKGLLNQCLDSCSQSISVICLQENMVIFNEPAANSRTLPHSSYSHAATIQISSQSSSVFSSELSSQLSPEVNYVPK